MFAVIPDCYFVFDFFLNQILLTGIKCIFFAAAEEESGEVQILNFEARTVGNMVYFMYHDKIKDEENMDPELLILADKYNVRGLMNYCVEYFEENLSLENALDVLVSAELTGHSDSKLKIPLGNCWGKRRHFLQCRICVTIMCRNDELSLTMR